MNIKHIVWYIISIVIVYDGLLHAYDTPIFYKPLLQGTDHIQVTDNWVSSLALQYGQGSGTRGWNSQGYRSSVLDIYGQTNITRLGVGMQDTSSMAVTNQYWKPDGSGLFDFGAQSTGTNGVINFNGKVASNYLGLSFEQNIVAGFFARLYIPIRRIAVSDISYTNQGAATFQDTAANQVDVADFMKRTLPTILLENGFTNGWNGGFSTTGVPEICCMLGWQANNNKSFGIIDEATGRIQAGLILPICGATDPNLLFAIPLGYDEMWGMLVRFDLEVGIWSKIVVGANSSLHVFLSDSQDRRLYTDYGYGTFQGPLQRGWIQLEKARVNVNKGSIWDIAGYVKGHDFFGGLVVQCGFAYTRQEATQLHSKNGDVLSRVVKAAATNNPSYYLSADAIINNDQLLGSWDRCDISFMVGYDFSKHVKAKNLAPLLHLEYALPVCGKRVVNSDFLLGGLVLHIDMPF